MQAKEGQFRQLPAPDRRAAWIVPILMGAAMLLATPAEMAHSDTASMVARLDGGKERWRTHLIAAPAGSVHTAELPFVDPIITGGTGAGVELGDGQRVAFRQDRAVREVLPDERRVNRAAKTGRILSVAPLSPPKFFSAGSILERTSSLVAPDLMQKGERMGFAKPEIGGREIEVAMAFYKKSEKPRTSQFSPIIADLVTNDRPDVLATAYAPPPPDYSRDSPFSSILREEPDLARGRFIPPVPQNDHGWAAEPLPPAVFSAKEQKCLAEGIYFEARGESVKGQAAVAQVILNRVRNPHYPDTICGVVYQNQTWRNRCQFSFACDRIPDRVRSARHWEIAEEVAMATTAGTIWLPEVGSSTHYHATYVNPRWARTMKRMGRIGLHVFYRTHGGGWS